MSWNAEKQATHLEKLLVQGLIGMYHSFEVTEIVGFQNNGPATNFLSLLVAEPGEPPAARRPGSPFINQDRILLSGTDWKFGVSRYRIAPECVPDALRRLSETGEWKPGTFTLKVGNLAAVPPQFVPSDAYLPHPWNGILKNNFWDGSHLLELFDTAKNNVQFLLDKPNLLTELAALIRPYAPIGIDGLSDRLGNVLIQLPVTVVVTKFDGQQQGNFLLEPAWHPSAAARRLRVSWEIYEDGTIEDFTSTAVEYEPATFPRHSQRRGARYVVWDECNAVILGASAQTAFFGNHVSTSVSVMRSTYREFMVPGTDAEFEPIKIPLRENTRPNVTGRPHANPREPWRSKRVFRDSLHALRERKEFVQYGGPTNAARDEALADIRWLLEQHGKNGAWLWDPFLNAKDILNTLFFCPHLGVDLRALTSGSEPPPVKQVAATFIDTSTVALRLYRAVSTWVAKLFRWNLSEKVIDAKPTLAPSWKVQQQDIIQGAKGNCEGLTLEFRIREGGAGWPFHDRFLIFPGEPGNAVAWSLGTSVNSLGRQHHILQKVSDGELIRLAFLELWNTLSTPDYLIWKTP